MRKPVIHLICNAHLDPVWQWRWDEGAAEAITTFSIAARLLKEFPTFVFNHNEAILYRWVQTYDPALFKEIQKLVGEGRWLVLSGTIGGKPTALGIVNSGQHGFDLKDGEVRLTFRPYEIKTIRFERDGTWNEVAMIEEEAGKRSARPQQGLQFEISVSRRGSILMRRPSEDPANPGHKLTR